jgi:hypothetical protein
MVKMYLEDAELKLKPVSFTTRLLRVDTEWASFRPPQGGPADFYLEIHAGE